MNNSLLTSTTIPPPPCHHFTHNRRSVSCSVLRSFPVHPLCCISTVSDNSPANLSMAVTARSNPNPGSTIVQPHNQNHNNNSGHFSNHHHHNHSTASNCSSNSGKDSNNDNRMSHQRVSSAREQPHIQVDVKINDIVGNGISGILYKWVNYGKGWRPRWFVLQDGVLSYFKIHGPDKILVNQETEKGSKVIGEESMRRMSRPKNGNSMNRRKPVGEIHLKV
ncbi:hypothetical protein OIU76_001920, partial [Salix suchowensis]